MSLFNRRNINKPNWQILFSDPSIDDINNTKKMIYNCLNLTDRFPKETSIIVSMTTGQRIETIIFFKMVNYHLITVSQIQHNLFYGLLYEFYIKYRKLNEIDTFWEINQMKITEKWYLDAYIDEDKKMRMRIIISRFYRSLQRLSNENEETKINISAEEFSQRVGKYIEEFHIQYLKTT